MEPQEITRKIGAHLMPGGKYAEEASALAQQWEALVAKLREDTQALDPTYEWEEWSDGPEEVALGQYLFWWVWGN